MSAEFERGRDASRVTGSGEAAAWWAIGGVALLFASAIYRLGARGVAVMRDGLEPAHWLALLILTVLFVYTEGVRALQRRWVPHLFRRAQEMRGDHPHVYRVLAPLYGLSLIGASRRTLVRAWGGTAAIIGAVLIVRAFPEPWRGITDFAVAVALAWGLGAIIAAALRTPPTRVR